MIWKLQNFALEQHLCYLSYFVLVTNNKHKWELVFILMKARKKINFMFKYRKLN